MKLIKSKLFIEFSKKTLYVLIKYFVPILIGWLEGDSHAVQNAISSFLM